MQVRTVGVEEEMFVVDPASARIVPLAGPVLRRDPRQGEAVGGHPAEGELMRQQVELQTAPCATLAELRNALVRERTFVAGIAADQGLAVAPLGTSPHADDPAVAPNPRYLRLVERYGPIASEQLACGCYIHVSINSRAEGVAVLDRIRPWLPLLLALSANSPYWRGADTSYASYRSQVWSRWPSAAPTEVFGSEEAYDDTVDALIESGGSLDRPGTYFFARLAVEHPTVEIRVADVCLDPEDALLVAALSRGLVDWAAAQDAGGTPPARVRTELLRAATWRAARWGMTEQLIQPAHRQLLPAKELLERLVELIGPALARHGDEAYVSRLVERLLARGTGSERQRAAVAASGRLEDAVRLAVRHTTDIG